MDKSITDPYLCFLGKPVRDKVRGLTGVATSVCFDLAGCVQVAVSAPATADGKLPDGVWIDVQRVEVTGEAVIAAPDFRPQTTQEGPNGPSEKPLPPG